MKNILARLLSSNCIQDISAELGGAISSSEISDFFSNSAPHLIALQNISCGQIRQTLESSGIKYLCSDNDCSSAVILAAENQIENLQNWELRSVLISAIENSKKSPAAPSNLFSKMAKGTLVMGILNITPDSFSDGGIYFDQQAAIGHAKQMIEEGADIIDVGGESTRPGAIPVDLETEINRVIPTIRTLYEDTDALISVDTSKPQVAAQAYEAGASIINFAGNALLCQNMAKVAANLGVPVIIMHMRATPQNMQQHTNYHNLIAEIYDYFAQIIDSFTEAGCKRESLILDPGFGFSKTPAQNLELIRRLGELKSLGCPLLIGTSRKSTLGVILGGLPESDRLEATIATTSIAIANGANIVRVHDVLQAVRAARTADAVIGKNSRV